jgi:hypothetical protein
LFVHDRRGFEVAGSTRDGRAIEQCLIRFPSHLRVPGIPAGASAEEKSKRASEKQNSEVHVRLPISFDVVSEQ